MNGIVSEIRLRSRNDTIISAKQMFKTTIDIKQEDLCFDPDKVKSTVFQQTLPNRKIKWRESSEDKDLKRNCTFSPKVDKKSIEIYNRIHAIDMLKLKKEISVIMENEESQISNENEEAKFISLAKADPIVTLHFISRYYHLKVIGKE